MCERILKTSRMSSRMTSENSDSTGSRGMIKRQLIFNIADLPDVIPDQSAPNYHSKFTSWGPYTKVLMIINQLIVIGIVAYYFLGYNLGSVHQQTILHNDIEDKLLEIHYELKRFSGGLEKYVDGKITAALDLYDADKVGLRDYALESAGASIISTPDTNPYPTKATYQLFGFIDITTYSNPRVILQPGTMPGQCFAFHGSRGSIKIKLSHRIIISSVALEHADTRLIDDPSSSPKEISIHGFEHKEDVRGDVLTVFNYRIDQNQLQTFKVFTESNKPYESVELRVLSNHGHPGYTCVYRFRVHGIVI